VNRFNLNRTGKRFLRSWATYPLRRMKYKYMNKILWALIFVIIALLVVLGNVLKPEAAEVTTTAVFEADTSGLNAIAAAISEQAARIDEYVDTINVSDVNDTMGRMSAMMNAPFDGAPVIIFIALGFVLVVIVGKKVLAR